MTNPSQLDRIEGKVNDIGARLGTVENWKAEIEGGYKAFKIAWKVLAAAAAVAGWACAHFLLGH